MSLLSVIEFLKTDFFRLEGFYDTFPDSSAVKHFTLFTFKKTMHSFKSYRDVFIEFYRNKVEMCFLR